MSRGALLRLGAERDGGGAGMKGVNCPHRRRVWTGWNSAGSGRHASNLPTRATAARLSACQAPCVPGRVEWVERS